jgi:hypothetical protein
MNKFAAPRPKPFPTALPKSGKTVDPVTLLLKMDHEQKFRESDDQLTLIMAALLDGKPGAEEADVEQAFETGVRIKQLVSKKRRAFMEKVKAAGEAIRVAQKRTEDLRDFDRQMNPSLKSKSGITVNLEILLKFALAESGLSGEKFTSRMIANWAIDFMETNEGRPLRGLMLEILKFGRNTEGSPDELKKLRRSSKLTSNAKALIDLILEFKTYAPFWIDMLMSETKRSVEEVRKAPESNIHFVSSVPLPVEKLGSELVIERMIEWFGQSAVRLKVRRSIGGPKANRQKDSNALSIKDEKNLNRAVEKARTGLAIKNQIGS